MSIPRAALFLVLGASLVLTPSILADPQAVPSAGAWFADTFDVDDMGLAWAFNPGNGGKVSIADGRLHLAIADPPDRKNWGSVAVYRGADVQAAVQTAAGMWPPQALGGVMLETTVTATDPQHLRVTLVGKGYAGIASANYRNGFPSLTVLYYGAPDGTTGQVSFDPVPVSIGHTYTFRIILRPDGSLTGASYEGGALLGSATLPSTLKPDDVAWPHIAAYTIAQVSGGARTAEYVFEDFAIVPSALEALPAPLLPR